jgi:predicted ATPase/class 3 adenylate cyclase
MAMAQPPVGTVTFLFTDIEGSTRLWQQYPVAMDAALKRHHTLLNSTISAHAGYAFQIIGDAFCAAFPTANDGMDAALEAQRLLSAEEWGETGALRVRMALHSGRAELQVGDFTSGEYVSGLTLSRTARLLSAGHGGQILLSLATAELVRDHLPAETSLRDLGARRLKDLIRPEQIFQVVAPDLPSEFAPLKTLDVHPHNLPVQLTSFIGRGKEIGEIKKLLTSTHLLTLTGIGGTGKTRLSLQVAADLIDEFPGGVWLVELAPLRDPALVEQTVASVLGVPRQPGKSLSEVLVEHVKDQHLLLILDNCEHVVEACAQLANLLLRSTPGLKILATSRVHLNLAGEMTYPVPPLALPDPGRSVTVPALAQYEAVRLFIERTIAVQPSFSVTNENAPAVAQICTRLDGIPLAIELAAARIRHLSPGQISLRLDDRFNLLTGGSRATLPRQQTLRAAMDWSYELLSMAERTLFNRLAVFAGSFSLEAVEAICIDEAGSAPTPCVLFATQVLDILSALVDHSLVSLQERNGENRYVLLETVRQYALEKLQDSDELPTQQDRHLAYYLKLAQEGRPHTWIGEPIWMNRFETEYENFRVAMEYAIATHPESAILLGDSLGMFTDFTYRNREAYGWAMRTLAITDSWPPGKLRATALLWASWETWVMSDDPDEDKKGMSLAEASLEMAKELGDKKQIKDSLQNLQAMGYASKNWLQMSIYAEQHLAISQELDDKVGIQDALWALGESLSQSGDRQGGRMYLEQALEIARKENYPFRIAGTLSDLARIARLEGDNTKAVDMYTESAQYWRLTGIKRRYAYILYLICLIDLEEGNSVKANAIINDMLSIYRELKVDKPQINCLAGFAGVAGIDGLDERSACLFGAVEGINERNNFKIDDLEHSSFDPIIHGVRERLGEAEFKRLWSEGRKLNLEQAIELAQQVTI